MTRRHLMTLQLLLVLADAITAAVVFLAVSAVRFEVDPSAIWSVGVDVLPAAVLFALTWIGVCWALGLYRLRARWGWLAEVGDIGRATVALVAVTLSLLFLLHQDDVSRLFLAILFVVQPLAMLAGRAVLRGWFENRRRRGRDTSYMLVAGTGPLAQSFADRLESHAALGVRVIGHLLVPGGAAVPEVTRPVLGTVEEMNDVFRRQVVDEVAVCLSESESGYLEPLVTIAADEGKTVRVPRDADEGVLSGSIREEFDGFLVQSVVHGGQRDAERAIKRAIDMIGATAVLVVLSPLLLATALIIRLRDGSPMLFKQTRVGLHGRPFTIYKFRTMTVDAEVRRAALSHLNEVNGAAFKISRDPRVTSIGQFLRRSSLDELPQLLNVLLGDMSLVGPRPALPEEVGDYDIWHRRRLSVRPGMTGLWQIQARMNDEFDERASLDLRYIDQWSLWMDLGILMRTVPVVLMARGR